MNQPADQRNERTPAGATNTFHYSLAEVTDVRIVADLKRDLREASGAGHIVLIGKNVERIDGAALQLLMSLLRDCEMTNRYVEWQEPSEAIMESARLTGLTNMLHLPQTE